MRTLQPRNANASDAFSHLAGELQIQNTPCTIYTNCLGISRTLQAIELIWLPRTANTDIPEPINKFPVSCGTQRFVLSWLQEPITGLYLQPDESSPRRPIFIIFNFHFSIIIPSTSSSYKWSLSFTFSNHSPDCISLSSRAGHLLYLPSSFLILSS